MDFRLRRRAHDERSPDVLSLHGEVRSPPRPARSRRSCRSRSRTISAAARTSTCRSPTCGSGKNMFDPKNNPVGALGQAPPDRRAGYHVSLRRRAAQARAARSRRSPVPTFNSYKGLIAQGDMPDMSWAPVLRCYGRNNRSAMLRLPMNRYCIENRSPDISTNFYLTAALSLAAGLDGMHHRIDPGAAVERQSLRCRAREREGDARIGRKERPRRRQRGEAATPAPHADRGARCL